MMQRQMETGFGKFVFELLRTQKQILGIEVGARLALAPFDFSQLNVGLDGRHDALGKPILEIEDVAHLAVESARPDMDPRRRIDELAGKAHPALAAPDAALDH